MTAKNLVLIVLSSVLLSACTHGVFYSEYRSVPVSGWDMDSVLTFSVPVMDPQQPVDVLLNIRHTDAYAYQNMWLFIGQNGLSQDTIEFYLADDRGQWLGDGNSIFNMPVLYRENILLTDSIYTLTIQQGMREQSLKGVSDIGVEIRRHGEE